MFTVEDSGERAALLVHLRRAIRQSREVAEGLAGDPFVGPEARTLLSELQCLAAELDSLRLFKTQLPSPGNDPVWGETRLLRH